MARGERERRGPATLVTDEVEALETRVVRDAVDPSDLGREGVFGRRLVAGRVHLEVLRSGIDIQFQLCEERPARTAAG